MPERPTALTLDLTGTCPALVNEAGERVPLLDGSEIDLKPIRAGLFALTARVFVRLRVPEPEPEEMEPEPEEMEPWPFPVTVDAALPEDVVELRGADGTRYRLSIEVA